MKTYEDKRYRGGLGYVDCPDCDYRNKFPAGLPPVIFRCNRCFKEVYYTMEGKKKGWHVA